MIVGGARGYIEGYIAKMLYIMVNVMTFLI